MLSGMLADIQAHWHYLLMPLVAGFVGYITKVLALEMMFRPIEFVGLKPPYLGWQGVLPRKAAKMAGTATDLLLGRLFTLKELMSRLDLQRLLQELEYPLLKVSDQLVREIGEKYLEGFWSRMPEFARRAMIANVQQEIPRLGEQLWKDLARDPAHYIDIKHLLVSNLVKDKVLLNEIFRRVGAREFAFFRNAGFWFGMALGVIQLACWLIWHEPWLIPAFGGLVGLVSDWIALQMLFRPLYPVNVLGFRIQGVFLARQKEVARDYAGLIATELLTPANLVEEILRGPFADRVVELVHKHVKQAIDAQMGLARPLVLNAIGTARYHEIRAYIVKRALEFVPETSRHVERYAMDALDINNTIVARMDELSPQEFEGMLRPAFKEDEKTLILCGAVLGYIIGEIQVHLML